ncbi:MAG: sel1 repeat family protein [Lachnospiraceae bacterium]|nr:sel1 repeat family protein [Lachnospiraceae bacterium]
MDEEYSGGITGKQLQRNPDEYIGQKVKFTGECLMVSENNGVILIGLNTEDEGVLIQGEISSDQFEQRVLESDVEKGIQYLKDAANAGEFLGLSTIGAMYYYGDLVEQDYDKAMEYFRKAVENGESHGDALNFIGLMYENGYGVETDYQIAFEYYEKAAKLGHETAKKNIRKLVDNGHISREEAAEWVD